MLNNYNYLVLISAVSGMFCFSPSVRAVDLTPELHLHGYATAGLAKLSGNQGTTYPDPKKTEAPVIRSDISSEYDSVVGLQLKYDLNDRINLVTQMYVAAENTPETRYTPKLNWTYIDYQFNDEWALRSGRFAFSTYLWSEQLHVGAAYPWARLPPEIYGQQGGLYSVNGVALIYKHIFGDWLIRVQPSFSEENLNVYQLNYLKQLAVSLSNDDLTLHVGSGVTDINLDPVFFTSLASAVDGVLTQKLGYSPAQINQYNWALQASIKLKKMRAAFSDMGFIYDDAQWFAAAEISGLRFSGVNRDYNTGYVSVGHYFGKWLPYIIFGQYKEVNLDELDAIPAPGNVIYKTIANVKERTMSVGARYQLKDNASLKFQADRIDGFNGKFRSGLFVKPKASAAIPSTLKSAYIYSVSLNMAF
ncbi:MAG: hypothetical protein H7Z73_11950 [Candidatus Saccharibacteria bacterium]|nr:hypothetical protein [Moraxellaceae bacterium]